MDDGHIDTGRRGFLRGASALGLAAATPVFAASRPAGRYEDQDAIELGQSQDGRRDYGSLFFQLLDQPMKNYWFVAQAELSIDGVNDTEEFQVPYYHRQIP